jgi:hypothetical protein
VVLERNFFIVLVENETVQGCFRISISCRISGRVFPFSVPGDVASVTESFL